MAHEMFRDFKSSIVDQNRYLKIIILLLVASNFLIAISWYSRHQFFYHDFADTFSTTPSIRAFCYDFMLRLNSGYSVKAYVNSDVNSYLENNPILVSAEEVLQPFIFEKKNGSKNDFCLIYTKDSKGLRAWELPFSTVETSFGIQVDDIIERVVDQDSFDLRNKQ